LDDVLVLLRNNSFAVRRI